MPLFARDLRNVVDAGHTDTRRELADAPMSSPRTPPRSPKLFYLSTPFPHPHCSLPDRVNTPETSASHAAVWESVRTSTGRFGSSKYANYHKTIMESWLWDRLEVWLESWAYQNFTITIIIALAFNGPHSKPHPKPTHKRT